MHLCGVQEPGIPAPKEGRTGYEVGKGGAEEGEAGEDSKDIEEGEPGGSAFVGVGGGSLGYFALLVLQIFSNDLIFIIGFWEFGRLAAARGVGIRHLGGIVNAVGKKYGASLRFDVSTDSDGVLGLNCDDDSLS